MKECNISMEEALEYLKLSVPGRPNDSLEQFKKELDVIADMYREQPEVEEGEGLTAAEFLDGLPVIPGLSIEAYLEDLFGSHGISPKEIMEQLGQEFGVSAEEALEQLRKAYETAAKEDKPLRLLSR